MGITRKRSSLHHWNFLQESGKLRGAMSYRLSSRNLSTEDMEEMTGIEHIRFRDYLSGKKPNLSNFEIIKIAKALGIDVELKLNFDDGTVGIP